ncbi:hypothetical protein ENTCAN_06982 [Enterobacter cancerogenus ATCC 35316]|nr:hypothetical protein ENTCAN_06982 [Enterobacter cancerogenus ATCC 35316]
MILLLIFLSLIIRALFFHCLCFVKVPLYLQMETSLWNNETSSKF